MEASRGWQITTVAEKLAKQGLEVRQMSRAQFADLVKGDMDRWSKTIRRLGIKAGE